MNYLVNKMDLKTMIIKWRRKLISHVSLKRDDMAIRRGFELSYEFQVCHQNHFEV